MIMLFLMAFLAVNSVIAKCPENQDDCKQDFLNNPISENFEKLEKPTPEDFDRLTEPSAKLLKKVSIPTLENFNKLSMVNNLNIY